ncbi:MAG TPA: YtxH domain-containing protein [bacterium]|nr:YtxH domain-containing protein [bacterium]
MTHKCNCHRGHSEGGGELSALLIGGLIGAGIAVYLHSGGGKKKLDDLKESVQEYGEKIEKKVGEIKNDKIGELVDSLGNLKSKESKTKK